MMVVTLAACYKRDKQFICYATLGTVTYMQTFFSLPASLHYDSPRPAVVHNEAT